jgi:hypothetical protein
MNLMFRTAPSVQHSTSLTAIKKCLNLLRFRLLRFFSPVFTLFVTLTFAGPAFFYAQTSTPAAAPAGKFPDTPKEFIEKLGEYMTANKRPDLEESYSVFKKLCSSGALSEADVRRVIRVANMLGYQNLAPYPYYLNYINAVSAARSDADTSLFARWHNFTEQVIAGVDKGKAKPIGSFLEFSADFMEHRALKTGEGGSVTWKVKGGKFLFDYVDKVPMLRCDGINLVGFRKNDSIAILETTGFYLPFDGLWKGEGGTVTWAGTGIDSTVYAKLGRYKVESVKPLFKCDTATLYYPLYFNTLPVQGRFEHNIVVDNKAGIQFPVFESFDKTLNIKKIGEGIEYTGGFKLAGNSLYGYGSRTEPAQLSIYNKKREKIFYGKGPLFIIKREVSIVAENVDAKLYMDSDSLFHPSADFRVDIPKQIITLSRGEKGSSKNPFFSSFYNMNLNTDKVAWYVASDSLEIGSRVASAAKGVPQSTTFESSNFFDMADYNRMQNIATKNPISTLFILSREQGSNIVSDEAFAQAMNPKFDFTSIQTLLAQMVTEGYINYYFERHEVELRDKLTHYALASQGKKDFDAIKIESLSDKANARLNLKTKETEVFEVRNLELSKRQRVALIPNQNEITLLENRDMRFTGRLFAGFSLFEGKDMHFTYSKYQVEFDSVQHLDFYLPTGNVDPKTNQQSAVAMNSTIERVSGVLLVDAPNNKAGREELAIFPSLQSKKNSFVYYDRPETQKGVYKRDSFYFKLDPFSFNGLDSYTKEQIFFKGEMVPATIFPPFKETIVVRDEDKSFGFKHKTPPTGYSTYSKKGNYTGEIDLSNKGFLGKGTLEYLTADIDSEDLIFRPKQTTGTARKFFMEEDRASAVKVPQAKGEAVSVNWLPFRDSMYVTSKEKSFELFKASGYTHEGVLVLTPSGLKGRGKFEWDEGRIRSKLISYGPFEAQSDTAHAEIKAGGGKEIAVDALNIKADVNFDKQVGEFKANSEVASTTMPNLKYRTSMNEFRWDMKEQIVTFKSDPKKPALFVSTDPGRDTLTFKGRSAILDIKANRLSIGNVDSIRSADAFIYPEKGEIEIESGGKMKELTNAKILADTISKYHTITRATVNISGKNDYSAKGYYQYNIPGFNQEILFDNIEGKMQSLDGKGANRRIQTSAFGDIKQEQNFRIDVKTLYKGKISLNSSKPNVPTLGTKTWFLVQSEVDRNAPIINIKKAKDDSPEENPLITGFYLSKDIGDMYPRILAPAYARVDRPIMDCQQVFKYDPKNDKFIFGDSTKLVKNLQYGPKMIFDNKTAKVEAEGPLNIGSGLNYMKVKASGRLKSDFSTVTDTSGFDVTGEFMTGMEIKIPQKLLDVITNDIKAASFDAQAAIINTNLPFYQPALSEFISDSLDRLEAMGNLNSNAAMIPKKDNKYAFVLGRHPVRWNAEYQSFLSLEDKIPVLYVNGEPLGKMLTTYVEYKMPTTGDDRFYLYLKPNADQYYFFGYQSGVLNVVSNNTRFMDVILSMKTKETQFKMPDGEVYEIIAANPSVAEAFVNRVRSGRAKE